MPGMRGELTLPRLQKVPLSDQLVSHPTLTLPRPAPLTSIVGGHEH